MLLPIFNKPFKKDIKLMERRRKDMTKINDIMAMLIWEEPLPECCAEHELSGNYEGFTECHVEDDWLLIYKFGAEKTIRFSRTGSHSDLF
ncbi:hypothetical protein FACS1894200_01870 [Spirochaetia bacterium]|nr:hypothetical protein FACS1894200_01870 [Spirochaetia bacterium]